MIKFSAGYNKINPNFVIQGLNESKDCLPAFSIMHNILTRGCPTIPSRLLREKFGEPELTDDYKYYLNFENLYWDETIKGGPNGNPALECYKSGFSKFWNIDPKYVGSFIPECSIQDIIYDYKTKKNVDSHVDFYSPIYKTVLEIDGGQHRFTEQNVKDEKRDQILREHKIHRWRVPTDKVYSQTYDVNVVDDMTKCIDVDTPSFSTNEKLYLYAIRLELLLANLYKSGVLTLINRDIILNLHTDYMLGADATRTIIEDFYALLTDILALHDIEFSSPNVSINFYGSDDALSDHQGINADISLTKTYCDSKHNNVYYIRNDYFLYENKKYFTSDSSDTYWYKKNNYKISFNSVDYHLNIKKHEKALTNILRNTSLNYEEFRENQLEIIVELLNNRAVIGILPTGAGKSLCYQLCSLLIPSMTLVVAPLQLLMADQARNMERFFGITNVAVVNALNKYDQEIFKRQQSLITIVSPERFFSTSFTTILENTSEDTRVGFVVIDEVHCLSEWGHDFRTSYLCLSHNLKKYFPSTTYLMALTGTASHRVFEDVELELRNFKNKQIQPIFAANMRRDNLNIKVIKTNDYYGELTKILEPQIYGSPEKVLVFTKAKGSRSFDKQQSACRPLMKFLSYDFANQNLEEKMAYYVGGDDLENDEKIEVLNKFSTGEKSIVLATKAFGMGVDIEDIRTTIHYGLPSSMESLYQEMGRAGRDGLPSDCYVLYKEERPTVLNRYFARPMISMDAMKEMNKSLSELQTNFYFLYNGNLDPEVEHDLITLVYDQIKLINEQPNVKGIDCRTFYKVITETKNNVRYIDFKNNPLDKTRDLVEKAFYRLFLLGEIDMWNVVYDADVSNPTYIHLRLTNLTEDEKLERLKQHIIKYQNFFDFNGENTFDNRLNYLINWVNENYLQERLQAMKTLYYQCLNFKSSDDFMSFIANYFSNDPTYIRLTDASLGYDVWIDAIKAHPEQTKERIARLLESYNQITGLNYVSGITRLRLDEFDDSDGKERLEFALNDISNFYNEKQRRDLFRQTYNVIEEKYRNTFVEIWIQHFPDDVKYIYDETHNEVAERYIITAFVKDLIELGGEFNGKLR